MEFELSEEHFICTTAEDECARHHPAPPRRIRAGQEVAPFVDQAIFFPEEEN